jgi:hypothetical protein
MAGRQINFFIGPSDQEPFERALRRAGDFAVLRSRSFSPVPEIQGTTVLTRYGEESLRVLLARPEDIDSIRYEPITARAEYSCSPEFAPILEFDRCYVSDDLIRAGRLYYIPKYYDSAGKLVAKSTAFLKWADQLLKAAQAALQEIESDFYAGRAALKLRASGVRFEGLS